MSEAEFISSYTALLNGSLAAVALYLTTISGFLIAAYLVGSKLNRSQLTIISTLFVTFSTLMAYVSYSLAERAVILEVQFDGSRDVLDWGTYVLLALEVFGILASVKFMIDIRNSD